MPERNCRDSRYDRGRRGRRLVVLWLWEDDVPLMRRTRPDAQFERLDLPGSRDSPVAVPAPHPGA